MGCRLGANDNMALELAAYRGSVLGVVTLIKSGLFVGLHSMYVHAVVEEGCNAIDASSVGDQFEGRAVVRAEAIVGASAR